MKLAVPSIALAVLVAAPSARAWESVCYEYPDTTLEPSAYATASGRACSPSAGPNVARQRWVGALDEHRAIFERTRERAGLPAAVSNTVRLRVFTSSDTVTSGTGTVPTLRPVAFESTLRAWTRAFTVGELAQLPDFSYALWDWATGHESCPLDGIGATPESCHGFATHMGPVNANHFVPLAGAFYARYHALALGRARECAAERTALGAAATRFEGYLRDCEIEALAIESVGQHFLQDAWSSGHMWQRWGSPDLADFPGPTLEERRSRAVLVALVSGFVHGSRGVLQVLPEWAGLDVNDALCAPNDGVAFVRNGTATRAIGDDFLALLPANGGRGTEYNAQSERLYSCAAAGLIAVYTAAGQNHGALAPLDPTLSVVDPTGSECFGQRVTNRAIVAGAAIQLRVAGAQVELPVDSRLASMIVPNLARAAGNATVTPALRNQFRLELVRAMSIARITAKDAPDGVQLAEGSLGPLLGAQPNGRFVSRTPLAPYIDPDLPWPGTADLATPSASERALALARLFHRGHAADWCNATDASRLAALRAHAGDTSLDTSGRAAACEACAEVVQRHLRVGSALAYDTSAEPLCHYLATTPAYVFQPASSGADTATLARAWCACP